MEPGLETLANLVYTKETESITVELNQEQRAMRADLARRGMTQGGSAFKADADLSVKRARLHTQALVRTWTELLVKRYGKLSSEDVNYLGGRIDQIVGGATASGKHAVDRHAQLSGMSLPPGAQSAIEEQLTREMQVVAHEAKRDLAIEKLKLETLPSIAQEKKAEVSFTYHLHGNNSRVNIRTVDNSVNNVTVNDTELFEALRAQISMISANDREKEELLSKLNELQAESSTPGFPKRYSEFIALASNHLTIVAPFLPALNELLLKALISAGLA